MEKLGTEYVSYDLYTFIQKTDLCHMSVILGHIELQCEQSWLDAW